MARAYDARMRVDSGGVGIEYDDLGEGPPVVLIHGFPDNRSLWRHQVPDLLEAGHRVIVPDLRGYGLSDKPSAVADYHAFTLAGDVLAVMDAAGVERAAIVGHDWGAAIAWTIAISAPARVERLAVLSVGHPAEFLAEGYAQHEKSWYMLLFQFEGVAERWLSADGWANFRAWSRHPDAEATIAALEANGSLVPALNYYRATMTPDVFAAGPIAGLPHVECPVLGVWGTDDMALTEGQMTRSARQVAGPWRYERIEGAGHWLPLDASARISELLVEFCA